MDFGLKGKVALVLAASRGLGRASATALAAEGASVVIGSRNKAQLEAAAQDIQQKTGSRVVSVPTDVTRAEDIEAIVSATVQTFGRLDVLVNNAGGPPSGKFDAFDDARWRAAFELTLLSVVRFIRLAVPHMRQVGGGRIINIVSVSVKQPIDDLVLSNAIRPGVVGLAKSLSTDLAADHITVNNICPGSILTDRLWEGERVKQLLAQGISRETIVQEVARGVPMKRLGKPEELGALVAFLASDQAAYITGTSIQIDGGAVKALF